MRYREKKVFNLQYAAIGFINTGFVAFLINFHRDMILKSLGSGAIQGTFSFFSFGINMAFFEYLHKKFEYKVFSVVLPSILTAAFSYVIHSINGSMRPLETALGVFVFAGFTFALMHFAMKRAKTINPVQLAKRGIKKVRRKK